jgi:hypothetical protein
MEQPMKTRISRRNFFALSLAPAFGRVLGAAVLVHGEASCPAGGIEEECEETAHFRECRECQGWGRTTCPACDGTGCWTVASESAGLYEREAARRLGHCAWCDEWGEAECTSCNGVGSIAAVDS